MNRNVKYLIAISILSVLALTVAITMTASAATTYSALPWASGNLVTANQLTIAGSSTVGPIAQEEINDGFVTYWNNLVTNNPSWGTASALDLTKVNLATAGSGTAIPALAETSGAADIGEMSRPPSSATSGTLEWNNPAMVNMQLYCVGIDSVAIVVSPDMTWFPKNLNTLQVAELFADSSPEANSEGNGTGTPLYTTWNDFFTAQGISTSGVPAGALTETIQRAVRDPTSGTFDCFNNYFVVPNGLQYEHKTGGSVDASENMAGYTYCEQNINVYDYVSTGSLSNNDDYIGFISLGYLESYGGMIGVNIAFNMASPPSGKTASPVITYYGPSGTYGQDTNSAYSGYTVYSWGSYVQPTRADVLYAYSGTQGSATGPYEAWRYLWEAIPGIIPSTGPLLAVGVWIAYMREWNTTTSTGTAEPIGTAGPGNFVSDNNYIQISPDDMTGGQVLDSTLAPFTPLSTQTQHFPSGVVNFGDTKYFVAAYIAYYSQHVYNPYADLTATGVLNFNDIKAFVHYYIVYYQTYI